MRQHPQSKAPNQSLVEPSFASFAGLKILVIYSTKTTFFVSGNFYRRFAFFSLRIHSQLWRFCHPHSCYTVGNSLRHAGENQRKRTEVQLLAASMTQETFKSLGSLLQQRIFSHFVIKRGKSCVCYCKNLELKRKKFCLLMQIRQET